MMECAIFVSLGVHDFIGILSGLFTQVGVNGDIASKDSFSTNLLGAIALVCQ
jgi:hypothetical protein